ncbi:MAG: GNAT family N-acetyltransferase [Comamonadaceae bacterium CG2_30_60_41]|nr:MAG: GNAT family N-acetyltransferase [Comamonadaceae bacterium CG2_30_60_41]
MFMTNKDAPIVGGTKPTIADGKDRASALSLPAVRKPDLMVPIRSLGVNHRSRIGQHLKALNAHDRYFRFGFPANDEQIQHYVDHLNFDRDEIFGIYNRHLQLIAMAHLAYSNSVHKDASAEFGVSVLEHVRGRGYGARLFDRAMMHARNEGVRSMYVHVLSENAAMLKIARNAGAKVERDGSESEGRLILPPATLDSRVSELVEEQMAQANYQIKAQAKFIRKTIDAIRSVWQPGMADRRSRARDQAKT